MPRLSGMSIDMGICMANSSDQHEDLDVMNVFREPMSGKMRVTTYVHTVLACKSELKL